MKNALYIKGIFYLFILRISLYYSMFIYKCLCMHNKLKFTILKQKWNARVWEIELNGVKIKTPIFMPVGTKATIKWLILDILRDSHYIWNYIEPIKLILANTFHLYLRPGNELIKAAPEQKIEFKGKEKEKKEEIVITKPEYSLSRESKITVGGKGFKPKIWNPVINQQNTITIEKVQKSESISESSEMNIISNDDNVPFNHCYFYSL